MRIFYRPHYVSDTTQFIANLKTQKPGLDAEQRAGRELLWDKPQDPELRDAFAQGRVAQQPYVYQTKA